ncbi:606_t:CDS:2 [Ambispora leptoticha]|uniref:606_t:CDS:1 n=1 Tax=Ambispora leptoticha TaxID=144679 RepID=A0A9N9DEZ3_9GLOM|nr:606_t:CDS:2 [Ambispora leptoticha]
MSSRQVNQVSICKDMQVRLAELKELAEWLAGPEKGHKPKESEPVPITFDEWADKHLCWEMDRMKRQMQFDDNNIPIGLKEEWVPEEKQEWKMESHGWIPSFNEYSNEKINIHKLLIMDQRA